MSVFSFRIRNNFSCCSHLSICSYLYYSNWQIMQLQATLKGKRSKKECFFCQEERNQARKRESNVQLVPKCNYMEHSDDGDASKIFDTI